jgi:four helix bundle protein
MMRSGYETGREELKRIGLIREGREVYFDFEKLKVYQRALDFVHFVYDRCRTFDVSYRNSLSDQLQRAALSISTNIAEGCGKASRREKIKYFSYALDSAKECIPCITLACRQQQVSEDDGRKAREDCTSICRMLGKLIQSVENEELTKAAPSP